MHKKPGGNHRAFFLVLRFDFYIFLNNEDEDDIYHLRGLQLKTGIPWRGYSASPTV